MWIGRYANINDLIWYSICTALDSFVYSYMSKQNFSNLTVLIQALKVAFRRGSDKKSFLKILQNSQDNICDGVKLIRAHFW